MFHYRQRYLFCLVTILIVIGVMHVSSAATLRLSGTVLPSKKLEITPLVAASVVPLETGGTFVLATINERSNNSDGYKVTLSSGKEAGSAPASVVEVAAATPSPIEASNSDLQSNEPAATTEAPRIALRPATSDREGTIKNLVLTIPQGRFIRGDSYSDTLTITLIAN